MIYSIKPSGDRKYIVHKVWGDINRYIIFRQSEESHILGKKLGINKFLVDVTEAHNTDLFISKYNYTYQDVQRSQIVDKLARVAILTQICDHSHDEIETVAVNNGLDYKLFHNRNEAVAFLLADR